MLIDRVLKDDISSLTNDCQVICIPGGWRRSIDHGQRLSPPEVRPRGAAGCRRRGMGIGNCSNNAIFHGDR